MHKLASSVQIYITSISRVCRVKLQYVEYTQSEHYFKMSRSDIVNAKELFGYPVIY